MTCVYLNVCPLRRLEQEWKIDNKWKNKFCENENNWKNCVRYLDEKNGIPHPDSKLPDGTYL